MDKSELKEQAEYYRLLYRRGDINRDLAKEKIAPYIDFCNKKSKEIAKKYNQRHKDITFIGYIR